MFETFFQSVAQTEQFDFLKSALSLELTETQLIACLLAVAVIVFAVAWYLDGIRRQFGRLFFRSRHSDGHEAFALADGDTDLAFFNRLPEFKQQPATEDSQQQTEVMEPDEEASFLEASDFLEPELREEIERPQASSSDQADVSHQELIDELAETKRAENELRTKLESANESLELQTAEVTRLDQELATASHSLASHVDSFGDLESRNSSLQTLADSLQEKLDLAESELEKQGEQYVSMQSKVDAFENESIELRERASLADALEEQVSSLKQELAERNQQVGELNTILTSSEATLKQNADEHAAAAETLQSKLDNATQAIAEQAVQQKEVCQQLDSKLAQSESELVALRDESTVLKSKIADLTDNASNAATLNDQLAQKAEELEVLKATRNEYETKLSQTEAQLAKLEEQAHGNDHKLTEALDSLAKEQALSAKLKKEIKDRSSEGKAELTLQQTKHSELEASFEALCFRHKEVEQKFASAEAALEQEQQRHARLKKVSAKGSDELREKANQQQQQAEEAERKLAALVKKCQQELAVRVELEETNQQLVADLDRQSAEYSKLEVQLREATQVGKDQLKTQTAKCIEFEKRADSLQQQAEEAEQKLSASAKDHEQEVALRAGLEEVNRQLVADLDRQASENSKLEVQLREAAQVGIDQLKSQAAKVVALEERASTLQQEAEEAKRKQVASAKDHEQEIALRARLGEANQQLVADLDRQASENSKLEVQLRELVQSTADNATKESQKLDQQRLKLDEVRTAFDKEKAQRAELQQDLESKIARIDELEKQVASVADNEADHDLMRRKLKKYKYAHRKNKEYLEQLTDEITKLHERASGYLTAVKTLDADLIAQREITAILQGKLDKARAESADGHDQASVDRLVQQQARAHVLSIKSQFEERIKKKNQMIRKLKSRVEETSSVG